ncbi:MAG: hypothetical protein A2Z83_09225 [Omnitrophica bacterium GWA2_52_8]|nr:MAG: hypothetical protein A2Z83_09225 [Omnitrophica bacterium GWA2_52_8]
MIGQDFVEPGVRRVNGFFPLFEAGVLKRIRRAAGARIRLSWFKKTKGASRPVKAGRGPPFLFFQFS